MSADPQSEGVEAKEVVLRRRAGNLVREVGVTGHSEDAPARNACTSNATIAMIRARTSSPFNPA